MHVVVYSYNSYSQTRKLVCSVSVEEDVNGSADGNRSILTASDVTNDVLTDRQLKNTTKKDFLMNY